MSILKRNRRHAFTLLELAVVLVIVGLMTTLVLQTEQAASSDTCHAETKNQMAVIRRAIDGYVRDNGRYPLPAGRSVGVTDPLFGREAPDADDDTIDNLGLVLAGALPTQTLALPEDYVADCWGNKFSYFVTETLTSNSATVGFPSATK